MSDAPLTPEEVTPEMIEVAIEVIDYFNRDIFQSMHAKPLNAMVVAIYAAMRAVAAGADIKSGTQAGLGLRSSQEVIWPNQQRLSQDL
jgi:hypothetical protein